MKSDFFELYGALYECCTELKARLEEAREALSEEQWEALDQGPFGEILGAAMDVEYYVDKIEAPCEDS